MKKAALITGLFCMLTSALTSQDYFFQKYNDSINISLSKAYDAVGRQFGVLGEDGKSQYYIGLSEMMLKQPEFGSEDGHLIDPMERKAILYYFNKLSRSFFSENTPMILSCMSNRIFLPFIESGLTQDQLAEELDYIFSKTDLHHLRVDEVYKMETMNLLSVGEGFYRVDIEINEEYLPLLMELTFWNQYQSFYFKKLQNGWRVHAIGGTGG